MTFAIIITTLLFSVAVSSSDVLVHVSSEREARALEGLSFDRPAAGWARVYSASPRQDLLNQLERDQLEYRIEEGLAQRSTDGGGAGYRDYAAMKTYLEGVVAANPNNTRLHVIGKSVEGRDLLVVRLTSRIHVEEPEPKVLLIGNMHGDEVVGRELLLRFVDYLVGSDPRAARLLDGEDIYVMPSMNPDGFEHATRFNAAGADLNRDFPDRFYGGDMTPGRQPETVALMNFTLNMPRFLIGANFHGGAVVANYPYDGNSRHACAYAASPDDATFRHLASAYAQANAEMRNNRQFPGGTTNGAEWYPLYGGIQDWLYYYMRVFEITLEVSQTKSPPAETIDAYWRQNLPALLALLEIPLTEGVRGRVADIATGLPVPGAEVHIDGTARTLSADPATGYYHELLPAGTHDVSATAPGYVGSVRLFTSSPGKIDINIAAAED